jgi:hypothetical protein
MSLRGQGRDASADISLRSPKEVVHGTTTTLIGYERAPAPGDMTLAHRSEVVSQIPTADSRQVLDGPRR